MISPPSGSSSGPGQGRKVLLVDDHPIQRQWVGLRLACEGFLVDVAADGPTALERARRRRPDAVLADVLMDGMDGFNLCAAIREDATLRHVPVVLASNVAMDRNLARAVGADALVVRCPDLTEVMPALLAALAGRSPAVASPAPPPASTRLALDLPRRTRLLEVELAGRVARMRRVSLPEEAGECLAEALGCAAGAFEGGRAALLRLESDGALAPFVHTGLEAPEPALLELARASLATEEPLLTHPGSGPTGPALARLGLAWLVATPLRWCGTTHGALLLGSCRRFGEGDLREFARLVGGWLGYALRLASERTRLSRRERRFLEALRTLDEAGERRPDPRAGVQQAVASILSSAERSAEAIPAVIQAACGSQGWDGGAVWLAEEGGARLLHCAGSWHGSPAAEQLLTVRRLRRLAPGQELAGQVWATGRAGWSTSAGSGGLRGAVACPIPRSGGASLGVLELVGGDLEGVDEGLVAVLSTVAVQLGQWIERKRAEERVRASETHTRSIIEAMPIGLIAIDEEGRIESVNPAAERMFGYDREELSGEKLSHLVPGLFESDPEGFRTGAGALSGPSAPARTCEGLRKTGRTFPIELTVCTLPTPDGRASFAAQVRDLSERCEVERLKSEFVAVVSHELRTPLTSIHGSLALLGSGALGELPGEARRVVGIAERNTVRLVKLINDILDIERLERGGFELDPDPIALDAVLERSVEAVRGFADAEGVSIALSAPTGALLVGSGDRLVQVMVNLLGNAVKFSPRGGTVTVTVAPAEGGTVEVRVADRGRGIPESKRGLIFGRFQQVEGSDARRKGGTGLGLAISKAIVERHGGSIGFESREGQGSEFWFRVPAAPPERRTGRVQVLRETGRTRR